MTGAKYGTLLQWAAGVTHEIAADDYRGVLGRKGIIHAYESPHVAVFMNPIHAEYDPARLWLCETDTEVVRNDQLLCGVRRLTCVEELPPPEIKTTARIRAAILCVWEVYDEPTWRAWATRWLSGEDRSAKSAVAEADRWAAVWVANAAAAEATATSVARWTANAATVVVVAAKAAWGEKPELDLHAIIERAIREEG